MKKILAIALVSALGLSLAACGSSSDSGASGAEDTGSADAAESTETAAESTETASESAGDANSITLWTYPIGNWGDETTVNELTAGFTEETGITVNVEYLNYDDGDDKVNTALTANQGPDVIMEGPERLVANWGAGGYMVDLSDIIDEDDANEIYESVMVPCTSTDGAVYEYPLVMTAHCMAVNYTAFVEAGADQYLDLDSHTWTTDDFIAAMQIMYDYYGDTIGSVYCGGQGGDQGTRALVNNLYGGTFTNAEHTEYTWEDEANIEALEQLMSMDSMNFDSAIVGADEIALFYQGILKVAFCWNIAQQLDPNSAGTGAGLTMDGDEIVFMSFPSESGTSELCGGIWGFGIFDNGDANRIEASKEFIKYMCDSEHTEDAVIAANYFAVRDSVDGTDISTIWADNEIMDEYGVLMQYMGDYYQVTPGWAEARTAWWNMLQQVGQGGEITETVAQFNAEANAAAAQ
ncbi:MAG: extracellular solute-binding protein [Lachnospiraceae bacterium]|nr:extracellular solute-binding protein [Lachnospiraceae bacterium]